LEHGGSGMEPRRVEHGGSGMEPRRVEHGGSDAESRRLEHAASARKPGLESRLHTPPAPPSRLVAPTPSPPLPLPKPPARRENEHERLIRRQLAQMRDILHLSQDFDAAFGTSRILEVLVLSVVSIARAETVLYFSERAGGYRLTHHRGLVPDAARELRLRGDSTLVQAALASERGVRIDVSSQVLDEERIWARQHGLQYAAPFRHKDRSIGLILLGNGSGRPDPDLEMLWSLLSQAALAYDRALLYETLQDRTLGVVRGLITLIESHNSFDCGSTEQVVRYTQALAREIQYPEDAIRDLVYGAVLRDVGMLRVSEMLLRSAQDLSADQWESIRRHPLEGASIMRQMRFSDVAVDVVLHHHEAYNGEGYPMGLRGRAIPLGARIVAVAESYVKMTMDRPYRKALGRAEALESLAENWGLRYDPLVVDALVRVVNRELSMGLKGDADLTRDLFGV
ncbi:MAG: HD domain-containing phosphohydrolase, partial [Candidatus Krumholzibacteriia bacterium]